MQLEATSFPEFTKACGKLHGEFEHLLEGGARLSDSGGFFGQDQSFLIKIRNPLFIGFDDGSVLRFNETVEQFGALRLQVFNLGSVESGMFLGFFHARIPDRRKHLRCD
ncbi:MULTISPECIES: hypothetical protein [unclassified Roseovarius]|uniref:hypothetical protein n=1 Tax=unclassified Roseovarius TaxID=2614913 RepID=UPI00273F6378|nr:MULTISPECIES: hypothetical protein [unclassified Roseovarius]